MLSLSTCTNTTCSVFARVARQVWRINLEQMCPVTFYKYKSAAHTQIYITRKHNSPTHLENGLATESTSLSNYYLASFTLQNLSLAFLADLLEMPNPIATEPALAWEYSHSQLCRSGIDIFYSKPVTHPVCTLLE